MYHPSYLSPKTILKIQTAQRSITLPLIDHLRISLQASQSLIERGEAACLPSMVERGEYQSAEYAEQIRILENITPEAHEEYMRSL